MNLLALIRLVCDLLEFTAVFLLAVEAIKLKNLGWVRLKVHVLHKTINPNIRIVDDLPKDLPFTDRFFFELSFLGLWFLGALLCLMVIATTQVAMNLAVPGTVASWVVVSMAALCVPLTVGLLAYTGIAYVLRGVIRGLFWLEENTRSGAVGILGFVLFATQFFLRRAFST